MLPVDHSREVRCHAVCVADIYRTAAGRDRVRSWCVDQLDGWTTPHERTTIATTAGETHLVSAGAGELTVLYVPGTTLNAATSLSLITAIAAANRVVVADVPGQPGLSAGMRPSGNRLVAYGRWVDEIVAHLQADRLVLTGHSLGAAITLAADTSGVAGLLLLDPAGLIRLRVSPSVLAATLPWLWRPTPARSARLLQHMHAPGWQPSATHIEWMTLAARHTRSTLAPSPLPASSLRRWLARPRAVLTGELDCFLPVGPLRTAVRETLGTDVQVLQGAGHLTPEERARAIVDAVVPLVGPGGARP
jgi:pimeloyl-ACP methyl ester carboxylesterase